LGECSRANGARERQNNNVNKKQQKCTKHPRRLLLSNIIIKIMVITQITNLHSNGGLNRVENETGNISDR